MQELRFEDESEYMTPQYFDEVLGIVQDDITKTNTNTLFHSIFYKLQS